MYLFAFEEKVIVYRGVLSLLSGTGSLARSICLRSYNFVRFDRLGKQFQHLDVTLCVPFGMPVLHELRICPTVFHWLVGKRDLKLCHTLPGLRWIVSNTLNSV